MRTVRIVRGAGPVTAAEPAAPVLVLDFDGVVCDAFAECALIAWLGVYPPDPRRPVSGCLPSVPKAFLASFEAVRPYARRLEHFLVAHHVTAGTLRDRAHFRALYEALPGPWLHRTAAAANRARERFRTEEPEAWLDLHTLYPGVPELLLRHAGRTAVVTAKDAPSVRAVLDRHGLGHTVTEVIGECGRKDAAVRELCARHGVAPHEMTFVDDNLANVRRVASTGARVRWALWGYHTAEDLAEATNEDVPPLALSALPELAVHGHANDLPLQET